MDMDSTTNTDNNEQLHVEETDDSCRFEFFEIVPVARDTDGSCTTESFSGDWSAEVKQENLADVKQEPDNVCYVIYDTMSLCSCSSLLHLCGRDVCYVITSSIASSAKHRYLSYSAILRFLPMLHQCG